MKEIRKEIVGTTIIIFMIILFIIIFSSLKDVAHDTGAEEAEEVAEAGISSLALFAILILGIPSVGFIMWIIKIIAKESNSFNI